MSLEELFKLLIKLFKRLIKMKIENMIGYLALMAIIASIGFSIVKTLDPTSGSNRVSKEFSEKADEADKVLQAATADRLRREALGIK